jgi:hypothetical protein
MPPPSCSQPLAGIRRPASLAGPLKAAAPQAPLPHSTAKPVLSVHEAAIPPPAQATVRGFPEIAFKALPRLAPLFSPDRSELRTANRTRRPNRGDFELADFDGLYLDWAGGLRQKCRSIHAPGAHGVAQLNHGGPLPRFHNDSQVGARCVYVASVSGTQAESQSIVRRFWILDFRFWITNWRSQIDHPGLRRPSCDGQPTGSGYRAARMMMSRRDCLGQRENKSDGEDAGRSGYPEECTRLSGFLPRQAGKQSRLELRRRAAREALRQASLYHFDSALLPLNLLAAVCASQ